MGRMVREAVGYVGELEESISELWIVSNLLNRLKCTPFIP
jgi:hypothetical protein